MSTESDYIRLTREDGVGRIDMERAEHQNALNEAMASDLRDATVELVEDDDVRCVVLSGSGGAFNTGADLATLEGSEADGRRLRDIAGRLHTVVHHLVTAPKPAITGVNGVAAGGGFGLALAGDLVIVDETARFEFAYPRIGLSGDGGSTYFLPRLIGPRRAREIVLLDEPIPPGRAVDLGLATEMVDPGALDDRVMELARELASGPTRAHGANKRLLTSSYDHDLDSHLDAEQNTIERLAGTEDYKRGHEAFFGDEEPSFEGN